MQNLLKLILVICALLSSSPAWATWTFKQAKCNGTSGADGSTSGTTSTISGLTAITAGSTVVAVTLSDSALGNVGISSINGETWTHCATCLLAAGSGASEIDASYVLSATGGETSFIVTMNTTIHGVSVCIYEAKSTVSALFDVANTSTITTSTPTTVADTLTGTNDFIVAGLTWSGNLTAVSASYANFIESNGNGTASNINTNSGSGAAFTPTTTGSGVSFTLAFQESGSAPIGVNFFPKTSLFKNTTVIN